jgi:Flp pilus assembly pilin Flp
MSNLLHKLWNDEAGFVLSAELILIATIVILATIVGLSAISRAVNSELNDVATAFDAVNQGANAADLEQPSIGGVDPQSEAP